MAVFIAVHTYTIRIRSSNELGNRCTPDYLLQGIGYFWEKCKISMSIIRLPNNGCLSGLHLFTPKLLRLYISRLALAISLYYPG